jgi:SAM-dependent methyltransferase
MHLATKIRNVVRGVKQRWGTGEIKRALWNKEFANGQWDSLEETKHDIIYQYLVKYCKNGSLLDLGCGSGNTGCELDETVYNDYTGVDISDIAIEKAKRRCDVHGRSAKNSYHQGDITTYTPDKMYDVILFRESIPYIPKPAIKRQLERYAKYLKPDGVFIVRWYHHERGQALLANAVNDYKVVEKHRTDSVGPFIIVMQRKQNIPT